MLSQTMQDALNKQVNREFYAAYYYLALVAAFDGRALSGFAHWMRLQAQEEVTHAVKLVEFILDRDGTLELEAIARPEADIGSPLEGMQSSLDHERHVSARIDEIYQLAIDESDYPSQVLMQWFVTEQVEEEKSAQEIVDRLTLAGDSVSALLVIDEQLGQRVPEAGEEEAG